MEKIIIFGAGQLAQLAHFYLTHDSSYKVVAFTVNQEFIKEEKFLGLPVEPFEEIEKGFPPEMFGMVIAVGYSNLNKTRAEKFNAAKVKGYKLISYINSKTILWSDTIIGENCFIFENTTIQPFVKIGDNVIIWSGSHIGHHSVIGNHCFIAPDVSISGNVKVEEHCFLGINSTIINGVTIARENIIGAGALIVKSTKEKEVYRGVSAALFSKNSHYIKL